MLVTVDVPDHLARQFRLDEALRSRDLLEAFLLQRYAEGKLPAGQIGEALGLDFYETEKFLHEHGAVPNVTPEEQVQKIPAADGTKVKGERELSAWKAELDAWAFSRPPVNHFVDDSRESIYAGRGE